MKELMKIVVGYDGSDCSEAALIDLGRAGLPETGEAVIVNAADIWPSYYDEEPPTDKIRIGDEAFAFVEEAVDLAETAKTKLQAVLPHWKITPIGSGKGPGPALIDRADKVDADLIVVGSHGKSALSTLFMGSVSQMVLHESGRSVRIARGLKDAYGPPKLIVGVDGSKDSDAALEALSARRWPEGTLVKAMCAIDIKMSLIVSSPLPQVAVWTDPYDKDHHAAMRRIVEAGAERLRAGGLTPKAMVIDGSPTAVLVEEARNWGADCIFLGAKGLGAFDRFLMGSVSSAVAARAPCSVEVIRS
jgi:nucleotide-binding universal stress UspA family protein